ncbi:MAG: hypothetical protein QOD41_966 [Cryptosporangiaceae bacterium]|jgi:hypothetical protein|nr:hypothetical protein [Cryptosporangiaceae bacterium]
MSLDGVRAIADAVLYEGYLLYPYRASSAKNRSRWQFGVLGPPHADPSAFGEAPAMSMQCLVAPGGGPSTVALHLRFLQLQVREVRRRDPDGTFVAAGELTVAGSTLLSWDEAVEREIALPALELGQATEVPILVPGGQDTEDVADPSGEIVGRIVRRRWPLTALVRAGAEPDGEYLRLTVSVTNTHPGAAADKDAAIRSSLIGAHVLAEASGARFVSLLEPPPAAVDAAGRCHQHRCWPVLAGPPGSDGIVLGAPIILYDHPQVAEQSQGALYDSTEIDEILTLRVMTMTEAEKAEARATDPRARAIIDRCDSLSPADLQQLHGILRTGEEAVPWWDPAADESVSPGTDSVLVDGVRIAKGSLVRVHPSRRADAQDLFFADQVARVTAVLSDVDGEVHVALVLVDDPAADLHEWYGRYLYFSPGELEPLPATTTVTTTVTSRRENRS